MRRSENHMSFIYKNAIMLMLMLCSLIAKAQPPAPQCNFSNAGIKLSLSKNLPEAELDAFIKQYDVGDLALKRMIAANYDDSIKLNGWKIEVNNKELLIITKKLGASDVVNDLTGFIAGYINVDIGNPMPLSKNKYGINNFRKQEPFAVKDSMVTFSLAGRTNANQVLLAGNFTDWQQGAVPMIRNENGWSIPVKLKPGKYLYKFIVDGKWMTDPANSNTENDLEGNNNSVFYVSNHTFKLEGRTNAKKVFVAGSFSNWEDGKLRLQKTATGWELPILLDTGTYTYRFIVDGNWIVDPSNPNKFPNEFNDFNSVISIGKPVLFMLNGLPDAKEVFLAGSFNDWRHFELKMTKTASGWEIPYVLGAGNYEYKFIVDGHWVSADGTVVKSNQPGSVFVIAPNYTFRLKNYPNATSVYLAGDFNGWSPDAYAMQKEGNDWVMPVNLSKGKHLYKFVVDGKWIIDPANELWEDNAQHTGNSIVWIP